MPSSHNKKLKIFAVCLLAVSAVCLTLALLKTTGVILKPKQTEAMKGSESVGGRYLKEESYWERYGVSPEGLVLWLSQSDARSYGDSANWYDLSGKGNHGTQTTADYQPGIVSGSGLAGFARSFDGVDDYVDISNSSGLIIGRNNVFSIAMWAKSDLVTPDYEGFVLVHDGTNGVFNAYYDTAGGNNGMAYRLWNSVTSPSYKLVSNFGITNWHHIVFVSSGGSSGVITLYVDGMLTSSQSGAALSAPDVSGKINLGRGYSTIYGDIQMDDVRIYNYARTADQIRADYNAGKAMYVGVRAPANCDLSPADCLNKGLVGYWDMDQMSGTTATDKSGNGNTGTLTNGPTWSAGIQPFSGGRAGAGALSFDGSNDYVNVSASSSLSPSETITVSFWANPHITGDGDLFIDSRQTDTSGFYFYYSTSQVNFYINNNTGSGDYTLPALNAWYHIVGVYDKNLASSNIKLYVNGILRRQANYTTAISGTNRNVRIGARYSGTSNYFDGLIDNVRIYNRALSEAEIRYQYNQGDPVAHWKVDEGSGTTAYDSSGNGNTGTLTNMDAATDWVSGAYGTALDFDGSNDYVDRGTGPTVVNTVAFWVYPQTTTEYPIDLNGTAYIWFNAGTATAQGFTTPTIYVNGVQTTTITAGAWQHIAVTTATALNATDLDIGRIEGVGYHEGKIDDVRIYNYARTADQIRTDYNAGKTLYVGARTPASCDASPADCLNKGLVGYWDMDQMSGTTATDKSGNGNTGTLTNGPTWSAGIQPFSGGRAGAGALSFDGSNDYVRMSSPASASLTSIQNITISAWIKPDSVLVSSYGVVIAQNAAEYRIILQQSSGKILVDCADRTINLAQVASYQLNNWQHIVLTSISGDTDAYLNGVRYHISSNTGTVTSNFQWQIGARTAGLFFDGLIDDVRIYNRALSEAEIRYQYNQGDPIAHWKFDEGADTATTCDATGSLVYDYSGNGNTGTLYLSGSPATSTARVEGKYNCAMDFDGTNDYVDIGDIANLTFGNGSSDTPFTISAWIKRETSNDNLPVVSKYNDPDLEYTLWIQANNTLYAFVYDDSAVAYRGRSISSVSTYLTSGVWHYVVMVYDGGGLTSSVKVFIDGIQRDAANFTSGTYTAMENTVAPVRIGYASGGTPSYANGLIDDVRIYNYARTAEQIKQDYNEGAAVRFGPNEGLP